MGTPRPGKCSGQTFWKSHLESALYLNLLTCFAQQQWLAQRCWSWTLWGAVTGPMRSSGPIPAGPGVALDSRMGMAAPGIWEQADWGRGPASCWRLHPVPWTRWEYAFSLSIFSQMEPLWNCFWSSVTWTIHLICHWFFCTHQANSRILGKLRSLSCVLIVADF